MIRCRIPLGTVVAFVALLKRIYLAASDLAGAHVDLRTSYAYFDRVFEVLDRPDRVCDAPAAVILERPRGHLEFKAVTFAYDHDARRALQHIDLHVLPGSTVAIVGPSGAGKSTLGLLAARLYDPTEGRVSIDGIDLRQVTTASLRRAVAVVTQETFLFHGTVLENLRYAHPRAGRIEIERAAKLAQIHNVIEALPDGYDTIVGAWGHRFSGGERQRLAIARAILADPRIVILDEATSALDNVSERRVHQALAAALRGKTTIVIAHRLSTVRHADRIIVLDAGRIVEAGAHEELLARAGLYWRLWTIQAAADDIEARRTLRPSA